MNLSTVMPADAAAWARARAELLPAIHPVDRDAIRIWCQFYPLPLADAFATSTDREALTRQLRIKGEHLLASHADTSHGFLYGHRYWAETKRAIVARVDSSDTSESIAALAHDIAAQVARAVSTDVALTIGVTFIGLLTLRQIGIDAFSRPVTAPSSRVISGSPDDIVAARQKDDSQGLFGFLRGQSTRFTIRFDETRKDGTFPLINQQHLTTAAADDKRDYTTTSGVRSSHEGPIPCDCRSASCGTCWVGVLGGAEKLSEPEPLEARRLIEFGYWPTPDGRPIIRLACMAKASGNATIVIPTWHGRIGVAGLGNV